MFGIFAGDFIDIRPIIPEKRPTKNSSIQTEHVPTQVASVQAPQRSNVKIQTDLSDKKRVSSVEFDPELLLDFLNRVTPEVCCYLKRNAVYDPFYRYKLLSDDDDVASTHLVHSLKNKSVESEFICTSLSWNSNGSALAVSYSKREHSDWCEHDACIAIWNTHRKDFNDEKPNTVIETDNCITQVAFHPDQPAVLAGAKYSGQVFVWNVAREDDMFTASSESVLYAHREPITGLFWSIDDNISKLISCSLDGKILIWRYREKRNQLELKDGFIVLAEDLSKSLNIKSIRPGAEVGVTCMSINSEDPSIFIIGTEGGGVFQCSFNAHIAGSGLEVNSIPLKSPITVGFEKHKGHVTSVHFSPFSRNVFLTSSTDGEVHLYNIFQTKPILKIHHMAGIEKAQWSLKRPMVAGAVTSDGQLLIFDFLENKLNPIQSLPLANNKIEGTNITFSTENPDHLCTSLSDGTVQMWILSSQLTSEICFEREKFKSFTTVE